MIVLRKGVRELPVRLTDDEKMRAGVELAEARQGIARAKAEVKRLTARLDELTDRITGDAREPVTVEERLENELVVLRRLDTLEVVSERRATATELRQGELPLDGDVVGKVPFLSSEEIAMEAEAQGVFIAATDISAIPAGALADEVKHAKDNMDRRTAHGITVPDPPGENFKDTDEMPAPPIKEPWDEEAS